MKKSIIALFAAATMVAGVNAQDGEGGSGTTGIGGVSGGMIASGVVVAGIVAGVVNNNSADAPGNGGTTPGQPTYCNYLWFCNKNHHRTCYIYLRTDRTVNLRVFEKAAFFSGFFYFYSKVHLFLVFVGAF